MTRSQAMMASATCSAWVFGCSATETGAASDGATTLVTGTTTGMSTTTTTSASADVGSGTSVGDTTTPGASVVQHPDVGDSVLTCDVWGQSCPVGEKCSPLMVQGIYHASGCVPIAARPREVGESCTVEGVDQGGRDDCVLGALCWDYDVETLIGECVPLCEGSAIGPVCTDPCRAPFEMAQWGFVFALCLTGCDPLLQDCTHDNQGCYIGLQDRFECAPVGRQPPLALGSPCNFINVCAPGMHCVDAQRLPDCTDADESGCCSPFCDTGAPDTCGSLLPGTHCEPWFEPGHAPGCESHWHTGICVL